MWRLSALWVTFLVGGVVSGNPVGERPRNDTLLASGSWDISRECSETRMPKSACNEDLANVEVLRQQDGPSRLRVSHLEQGKMVQLAEIVRGDRFLGMIPTRDAGGNLITLWVGGSAYKVLVVRYADGQIKQVLDVGTRSVPELVWCAGSEPAMLVARWDVPVDSPDHTARPLGVAIYCWKGDTYVKATTVPWKDRFAGALAACGTL